MPESNNLPIAIDYAVSGPRTAAGVASGQTRLIGMSYVLPGEQPRFLSENLADLLHSFEDRRRVYHDALFSLALELQNNLPSPPRFEDTKIMLHLLGEEPTLGLPPLADRASQIARLYPTLSTRLWGEGLLPVYQQIELPVVYPTLAMILSGVPINRATLEQLRESHEARMEIERRRLCELADREIDPDSVRAVLVFLRRRIGRAAFSLAGGDSENPSLRLRVLRRLAGQDLAVEAVLRYKESKLVRDAAEALLSHADSSERVHAELEPLGAVTGRFSCRNPNLQGLPAPLLAAIEAPPGNLLLEADFSQCELRVLAHFSQDERLLRTYTEGGVDLHRETAAQVMQIAEDEVTEEQRNMGKQINFSIIYGMTEYGLNEKLEIAPDAAHGMLDRYFAAYPGVQRWIYRVRAALEEHAHVRTLFGRRRQLPEIWQRRGNIYQARREAVNTIIQGTAADLLKLALVRLNAVLPTEVKLLLTVHDSVLLEVPEHLAESVRSRTIEAMETLPAGFTVPLKVDVRCGRTWAECK